MFQKLTKILKSQDDFILILCLVYYILVSLFARGFFSVNNSYNLMLNLLPILIVAIGQTFVILTAGIDLSVTSTVALTSIAGGYVMSADSGLGFGTGTSIFLGILVMIFIGFLIGLLNGLAITKLGMPAFMVTLTMMMFMSGFAIWITKSQNIYNLTDAFVELPYSTILFVPIPLIMGLLLALLAHFILTKTLRGEWIYAVGLNPKVANISGVKVHHTIIFTYIFSGICAALASVIYTARLETGSPVMGQNILLDVIGAVIIGGTSLFGGKGKIKWTIYGVLFITLVDNSLNIMGLPYFLIMIVKGLLIIFAAIFNVVKERKNNIRFM
jgi:ribose/xylose/arabinose/galactoside ABC-type transport system permease subunit